MNRFEEIPKVYPEDKNAEVINVPVNPDARSEVIEKVVDPRSRYQPQSIIMPVSDKNKLSEQRIN